MDDKNTSNASSDLQPSGAAQPPAEKPLTEKLFPSAQATTPVRLLYDTWDADEKRVPAGAVVDLPLEAAKALIKDGKAERADPLPGEKTA